MEFGLIAVLAAAFVGYLYGKQKALGDARLRVSMNPHIPEDVKELVNGMLRG